MQGRSEGVFYNKESLLVNYRKKQNFLYELFANPLVVLKKMVYSIALIDSFRLGV